MCATACALPAQPRRYSRPARCWKCTVCPRAFRESSMSPAIAPCSARYTQETKKITASLVRRAAGEVYGRRFFPTWLGWLMGSLGVVALAGLLFFGWQYWRHQSPVLSASRAIKSAAAAHVVAPTPARCGGARGAVGRTAVPP